ncbi:hypothetical protein HG430_002000 [Candidatus Gracilibacteria bacterium]|nr:hypothetical protein [Candidatus Gracilibacteria bacterium]MBF0913707.1 hypothetical protein [Candidatus Gracilibacteria bacterium]
MFYTKKAKDGFFLSSDETVGEFGPFQGVFCKGKSEGKFFTEIDLEKYNSYKFALGFTKTRVFILKDSGQLKILSSKK